MGNLIKKEMVIKTLQSYIREIQEQKEPEVDANEFLNLTITEKSGEELLKESRILKRKITNLEKDNEYLENLVDTLRRYIKYWKQEAFLYQHMYINDGDDDE